MARSKNSVTQRDVAEHAGVSSAVVSYVINNGPRMVNEETKKRVLKAIDELGYRPNKFAQNLKVEGHQAERQIGIIMGGTTAMLKRPYYGAILAGIYDETYQQGKRVRFVHFIEELHDPVLFNEHIHNEEVSALILLSPHLALEHEENLPLFEKMIERVNNIVCLEKSVLNLPAVMFDREEAGYTAVTHLIAFGHWHIAFMGRKDERYTGYLKALNEHGLPVHPTFSIHPGNQNSMQEGAIAASELLGLSGERPTAVFAVNDEIAIGAINTLQNNGVRVPEDIAVVSVDDTDMAALVRPALSTIRVPMQQMGTYALRILETTASYSDNQAMSVVLPTELIIRESCGARRRSEQND